MSQDFISQDDWADAMSATEVFETERKVRYPEDGEKLTRVEVVRMLNGMTRIAEDEARIAEVKAASYRHALNILEAME